MLVKDLYQISNVKTEDQKISAEVLINADSRVFKGHFPGQPITPGVMQLDLIKSVLETAKKTTYKLSTLSRCKFLAIWNPSEHPNIKVELTLNEIEDGIKVNAIGKSEGVNFFKFSALYK